MEALELYKEETRKMEEHKYACQSAEKEVETRFGRRHLVWSLKKRLDIDRQIYTFFLFPWRNSGVQ